MSSTRFTFAENTINNSLKASRAKFLGSDGLFYSISPCKPCSLKNPFATITSLSELYFRFIKIILSVQTKQVKCSIMDPDIKIGKSYKSKVKNFDFGVITENNMVFFVVSMKAKNKLDTPYSFRVFNV